MISSVSEASFLTANTNYPLPHALPRRDTLTCMHTHEHSHMYTLNYCTTLIWLFSLQAWVVQAVWPSDSAWGLFNPRGFSQNASAPFNGEQRISTQLPQSPPLSPGVSLYLHMSKKQELWCSLALFIPASKSCPRSLHLPFPIPLQTARVSHFFLSVRMTPVKHSAHLLFPQNNWVTVVVIRLDPCYFTGLLRRRNFPNRPQRGKEVTRENERWATLTE